jgi:phospholipid/cholesterol/gamma-HCH transport system substrate-binding protein
MSMPRRLAARLGLDSLVVRGVIALAVVLGVTIFVFGGLLFSAFGPSGETVRAVFANTNELNDRAEVRLDGVEVGRVREIDVDPGGRSATVEMEVFDEAMPLYADARAHIRWRNLLGGTVIVTLDRGTPKAGELGDRVIPKSRTTNQVELDPLISVLRGEAKAGLRTMFAELPRALDDPEALASALDTLADVSPDVGRAVGALRGERYGDLRRLVANTARVARAVDRPAELRDLIEGGAATLETTARREADVRLTIDRAAAVEPRVVGTLRRLDSTLSLADPLIARLREPADELAPTAARLRPVLSETDQLLRDARPVLSPLRQAARGLAAAGREGRPVLDGLAPSLQRTDRQILPDLARRDPVTDLATYELIGPQFASWLAFSSHFDSRGYAARFPAGGGERLVSNLPCSAFVTDPESGGIVEEGQSSPLVRCETLETSLERLFTFDPFPESVSPGGGR